MKKELLICDVCNEIKAVIKCSICDSDLCKKHARVLGIQAPMEYPGVIPLRFGSGWSDNGKKKFALCDSCVKKMENITNKEPTDVEIIFEKYVDFIREMLTLMGL